MMTTTDQIRLAHAELVDIAWELQQADLKDLEARVDKVLVALYVAMGGEYYGQPIPDLGVDGVSA
jgi:hypothetical protein